MRSAGQALIETGLCLPVLLGLGLGAAATIRVADARAGLDAACSAAVATAARAPDPAGAVGSATARFQAVAGEYPLRAPSLRLDTGAFERGGLATCDASATVDLSFAPLPGRLSSVRLASHAGSRIDDWRSRH